MTAERSEWNSNATIVLKKNPDDKFPFSFGLGKAKLILEHLDDIKKFVEEEGAKKGQKQ